MHGNFTSVSYLIVGNVGVSEPYAFELMLYNIFPALIAPIPGNVAVSPVGCQSLQVTWVPRTPISPLTLIQHCVTLQTSGGVPLEQCTTNESPYNITGLKPATNYTVKVRAQTQLGCGQICCSPFALTHNGKACAQ